MSAERRKNRNVRTRNLIQLAGDVLNLFPDLKNQFEASVTKDDYNRSGEIARREIVAFISSKKGLPIPAAESENVIDSDSPAHDETPSAVSLQAEPKNKDSEIVSKTTPAPSKGKTKPRLPLLSQTLLCVKRKRRQDVSPSRQKRFRLPALLKNPTPLSSLPSVRAPQNSRQRWKRTSS